MRGKEASRKLRGTLKGITPAYAGKSQCNSSCTAGKWDHPRVCGEKPRQDSVGALEGRITPACAGKSFPFPCPRVSEWDHPRMCGEKLRLTCTPATAGGITPACAGKRRAAVLHQAAGRDHPRMCGEKHQWKTGTDTTIGSPPHVRGKGNATMAKRTDLGITPACAGKRCRTSRAARSSWDHPRMCGEKSCCPSIPYIE